MKVVRLTDGTQEYLVVPEQITHLKNLGTSTELFFVGGQSIKVDGDANSVALRLQGR